MSFSGYNSQDRDLMNQSPANKSQRGQAPQRPPPSFNKPKAGAKSSMKKREEQNNLQKINVIKRREGMPEDTFHSESDPYKDYDRAAPKFTSDTNSRRVNSKFQSKSTPSTDQALLPLSVGSTYIHTPNAAVRPHIPKPPLGYATLPKPYTIPSKETFKDKSIMSNIRAPDGSILGSETSRIMDEKHVPYLAPVNPVGPDNPVVEINDTWSSCWDDQAGAIYYYNQITGEATWIPPDDI